MNPENRKYRSIHIPKTGGTTLKDFYRASFGPDKTYFFYPHQGGLYRSDQDPIHVLRFSPTLQKLKDLFIKTKIGHVMYKEMYKYINRDFGKEGESNELPNDCVIIHGHFSPNRFDRTNSSLITAFRDPLKRTQSHYRFFVNMAACGVQIPGSDWFDPKMSFEEFTEQEHMRNYQAKYIEGTPLSTFSHVGVTDKLASYSLTINPDGPKLRRLNTSDKSIEIEITDAFRKAYCIANQEDIRIYKEALNIQPT